MVENGMEFRNAPERISCFPKCDHVKNWLLISSMPLAFLYWIQPRRISQGVRVYVHMRVSDNETFLTKNSIRKLNLIYCHQIWNWAVKIMICYSVVSVLILLLLYSQFSLLWYRRHNPSATLPCHGVKLTLPHLCITCDPAKHTVS